MSKRSTDVWIIVTRAGYPARDAYGSICEPCDSKEEANEVARWHHSPSCRVVRYVPAPKKKPRKKGRRW